MNVSGTIIYNEPVGPCAPDGVVDALPKELCSECRGVGEVERPVGPRDEFGNQGTEWYICVDCGGQG